MQYLQYNKTDHTTNFI